MGHRIRFFLFSFFIILSIQSFGQSDCNLGVDTNGDGLVDCSGDAACQFAADVEKGCNCADGIDNDGDGQTDTSDPECANFYGLSFVGDSESCDGFDDGSGSGDDVFDFVGPPLETSQNTVDTQSKIAIGDVNCDGIPDVITTSKFNQEIRVVATTDGQPGNKDIGEIIQDFKVTGQGATIFPFGDKFFFEPEILIADIDGSCPVEIYSIVSSRTGNGNNEPNQYFLVGFRANPTPSTNTLVPLFDAIPLGTDRPGSLGIADFDCDGEAEIFIKDQVYDAETGELLADANLGNWDAEVNSAPIAADIIEGGNLEIVSGSSLLSVPSLIDGSTQAMTVIQDMNDLLPAADQWYPKTIFDGSEYGTTNWSSTSVADVNNDGHLDIVISGAKGSNSGPTTIYFWDVFNGTVDVYSPPDPDDADGWPWGTSRVNLGDIDGDGKLELTFIAGNQLFAMEESGGTLTLKWQRTINDSKSGIVSTTVYDFDNDGNPEVVYRDSQELVVIDGETGQNVLWSVPCQSHTSTEGPLIADIDGDGSTDLCAGCATAKFDINDPIQQQALGQLECYYSEGNDWLPTRDVWNQQGYAAVNIADDLTVPCPAFDMTAEFLGDCDGDGVEEINRPLNTFMNQVPTFGQDGCPFFPAPDISFVGNDPTLEPGDPGYVDPSDPNYFPAVEVIPPICGDLGITVGFNIVNSGSLAITDDLDVSFWEGDPSVAIDPVLGVPAALLHTTVLTLSGLQVGDTLSQGGIVFDYSGETSTLYIVLNDDGTEFPIDLTSNEFAECFIDNNIYAFPITPDPFTVTIEKIADNSNCDAGVSGTDSGELRAVVSRNGVEILDYSDFAFQWYIGTDDTGALLPANQGGDASSAINLGNGDYALVVTNTDKGCASIPVSENIIQTATTPVATIQVNSNQTICSPPNGELEVVVSGDLTGVTFDWRDEFGTPLGITGPIASDLTEGGYAVIVERGGCPLQLDANLTGPLVPDIVGTVTQNIISCTDLNTGAVTSQVFLSGVAQDPNLFTFNWYFYDIATSTQGSALPPSNGTGPSRTGLAAGGYAVYATQISTGCTTTIPAIVEVLDTRQYPTALVVEVAPQTSCDPANPNGILEVQITNPDGTVGNPADYTIEWFRGSNTLPANLHTNTSADGTQAFAVEDGGIPYTAKVTDVNGCFDVDELTVSSNVIYPVATLTKISDNNICDETLAGTSFNGAIQISVEFDGANVPLPDPNYEITWYNGGSIGAPIIAVADNTNPDLTGLPGGQQYTAVITRTDLSCPSNIVTVNVANIQTPPAINFTMYPSTRCVAPFNGGVVLDDVDGVASSATFLASHTVNWYDGNAIKFNGSGVRTPDATGIATYLGTGAGLAPGDQVLLE
ncbi:FG-GAP repeat domain-containing protein, partial [Fulvivirga lutimaris]|uniref:FG-GAP repeat domain-containing protein n=1 Tax=Fulvivirga lutimaris TaxID=1819566 RepID=UPI0012BCA496